MTNNSEALQYMCVMVVDDVFNVRSMLRNMLGQIGFVNIHEAADGYQALDIISKEAVDLILCDWNMPKMKGGDVLRYVRDKSELKNTPFLLVTGEVPEDVLAGAAETEVDDYLLKPFTMQQLQDKIVKLLDRKSEVSDIDAHLARGRAYVITQQFGEARAEFMAALAVNPASARTLYEVGALYRETGNDFQAKNYLHRALEADPKFLKAAEDLADLYEALGDLEKHIKYLQRAVAISPRDLERRMKLADSLMKNQRKGKAGKIFSGIMADASNHYSDLGQRVGQSLIDLGDYAAAEEALTKALEANPKNLHLFNDLGIAYRRQGKIDEAVTNYQRALEIAPKNEKLLYNLARAYYEGGKLDQASGVLNEALEIKPDFNEAAQLLVVIEDKSR